jgi:RNA polymerase sigma-70 factor (ECF subfamily)
MTPVLAFAAIWRTAVPLVVRHPKLWSGEVPDVADVAASPDACLAALAASASEQVRRRALDALYRRYVDAVYGYAYRRLGSREDAEDATSDVFQELARALPAYRPRPEATFRSWLFTIAHHVIADHLTRRERDRHRHEELALDLVDAAPSPAETAEAADEGRWIRAMLGELPQRERQVIELDLAGLKTAEIAAVLGLAPGAVHTARSRALDRLRSRVGSSDDTTEAHHATTQR